MSSSNKFKIPTIPRDCGTVSSFVMCREIFKMTASKFPFHKFVFKDFKYSHALSVRMAAIYMTASRFCRKVWQTLVSILNIVSSTWQVLNKCLFISSPLSIWPIWFWVKYPWNSYVLEFQWEQGGHLEGITWVSELFVFQKHPVCSYTNTGLERKTSIVWYLLKIMMHVLSSTYEDNK